MGPSSAPQDTVLLRETACSNLKLPPSTYIYTITTTAKQENTRIPMFPSVNPSDRLLTISSDDSLFVLDPATLKRQTVIQNVHKSVTSLKRYASTGRDCTTFMTTGRDGYVRGWDVRTGSMALEFQTPEAEPLSALACDGDLQAVVAGMELHKDPPGDVSIFGWDVRMPGQVKMTYAESHNDTVTELKFIPHAQTNTLLLSAGTDGLVNIFDTAVVEEDDALFQVIKSTSALQHAGLVDGDIYSLGTDETLSFHAFQTPDLNKKDPEPAVLGDVREQFGCEYVIDLIQSGSQSYLATGKHSEHWINLIPFVNKAHSSIDSRSWEANLKAMPNITLLGAHGDEIVRDVFAPEGMTGVYTCGEDGVVRCWGAASENSDVEMGGVRSGKKRKGERTERSDKRKRNELAA